MSVQKRRIRMQLLPLILLLASCASPGPARRQLSLGPTGDRITTPRYFGLYAVTSSGLVRLNGGKKWEIQTWNRRNNLGSRVRFLVFSRWLSMDATPEDRAIVLERVAHVRATRTADGRIVRRPDIWASPNLPQYRIPLRYAPVRGHSDMLMAAPTAPLEPGLYSLSFHAPESFSSRFGVAWPSVAVRQYDARYCVDKLPTGFVPCRTYAMANADPAVAIRDLHSSRTIGGGPPQLVIDGDVVNTSQVQENVPPLSVVLLNAQDEVLQSLRHVSVRMPVLLPGQSYHFRIVVTNAATNATQVRVTPAA